MIGCDGFTADEKIQCDPYEAHIYHLETFTSTVFSPISKT